MSSTTAQLAPAAPTQTATAESSRWRLAVLLGTLGLLWFEVVSHLRMEWEINPQYSYGWTVPFLALYLFIKRWPTRPAPSAPEWRTAAILLAVSCAFLFLPARIISIANPDWRLLSWLLAFSGVAVTGSFLYLGGGANWLRYFAFPVIFFFVATPWPTQFEQLVVQNLMRANAAFVVAILNLTGTVALQQGNVIELSTGLVGVEDACSGVRSLQSTFMVALFLGEFYRMTVGRRVLLVLIAAVLAFTCNLIRTLVLCLVAARSGPEAVHAWHDSAGYSILGVCLIGLWLVSLWLTRNRPAEEIPPRARADSNLILTRCSGLALVLLVWFVFTEGAAAAWYRIRGADQTKQPAWTAQWPEKEDAYAAVPVAENVKNLLLYNEGGSATWRKEGREWPMYYFRWLPGRTAALFVKVHRPDVCLPASGLTMRTQSPLDVFTVNDVRLPYRTYRFEGGGQNFDVLYCYSDGRSEYTDGAAAESEDWSARGRFRAAWHGRREVGARMLELVVTGYESESAAREALLREVQNVVRPD